MNKLFQQAFEILEKDIEREARKRASVVARPILNRPSYMKIYDDKQDNSCTKTLSMFDKVDAYRRKQMIDAYNGLMSL